VHLVGFYYKNISRCMVLWMSNRKMSDPHRFTDEQLMPRVATCEDFIQASQNCPHFLFYIVTGDECWVLQYDHEAKYEACPQSIQPFWISQEPVAWPWCNLAASQRRPPWTVSLPWGVSVSSEMPLTELVYCASVALTVTELADQLHHDNTPAPSTALVQAFLAKHHITQVC
jgi:hypothetical protein